ncbi:MAG TPA: hypothetical protein VFK44_08315 [Bacillales bacterium]|nr:hypothetical protein [Bacillales bacterium]
MLKIPLLFVTLSVSVRKRELKTSPQQRYEQKETIRRVLDEVRSKHDRMNLFL